MAKNFLLLNKLKKSKQIIDPQLQVRCLDIFVVSQNIWNKLYLFSTLLQYTIVNEQCDRKSDVYSADIQISVSAPAIFVYIQVKNEQIETYKLSKNGFIQLTSKDLVTISFYNRNCAMAFTNDDIQISTVNDFLTT